MNQIPVPPPLPIVIPTVNIEPKIVEELLNACRSGHAEEVRFLHMTYCYYSLDYVLYLLANSIDCQKNCYLLFVVIYIHAQEKQLHVLCIVIYYIHI